MRIGVFDSGVGGITVLTELKEKFPGADYVYFGDNAHLPYGIKSPAQVERFSVDSAKALKAKGVDVLVVACNTASSIALPAIRGVMGSTPVFGVVEPGVDAALDALSSFKKDETLMAPVLILATKATVQSQAYGNTLRKILTPDRVPGRVPVPIIEQACPLLVPMIEEGWIEHPILQLVVEEYVKQHKYGSDSGVALLGCTHYPWIHAAFEKALPGWKVVNSAQAVTHFLSKDPAFAPVLRGKGKASVDWTFTDPEAVPAFARQVIEKKGWA